MWCPEHDFILTICISLKERSSSALDSVCDLGAIPCWPVLFMRQWWRMIMELLIGPDWTICQHRILSYCLILVSNCIVRNVPKRAHFPAVIKGSLCSCLRAGVIWSGARRLGGRLTFYPMLQPWSKLLLLNCLELMEEQIRTHCPLSS